MNQHPYLRAYMAGIALPTMFMLIALAFFCVARFSYHIHIPIERLLVFPMTLVPNLWGAWNMLYVWIHSRRNLSIGLHGAALLFIWVPISFALQWTLHFMIFSPRYLAVAFPIGLVLYYLMWKHVVGLFNEILGIAG